MAQIKKKFSGVVICESEGNVKELAESKKADLPGADLSWADLSWADLSWANLYRANLSGADLSRANLSWANLSEANLSGANLSWADLSWADLPGADLSWADLSGAKIEFWQFPSIRLLSSINLGTLSDDLTTELFRRDMAAHPKPKLFKVWAKENGTRPYQNEERFWFFNLRKECWKPGKPKMTDVELIFAICKEKGWKIKGY